MSHDSSLKGRWIVENISFDFDERRNTPDMISQFGEEESRNELIFKNDSVVYIKMLGFNGDYQYFVNEINGCMHEALLVYPGLEGVYEVKENESVLRRRPGFITNQFIYLCTM